MWISEPTNGRNLFVYITHKSSHPPLDDDHGILFFTWNMIENDTVAEATGPFLRRPEAA